MKFTNQTIHTKITEAIYIAESLLLPTSKMMLEIKEKNDWQYDSGSGDEVYLRLLADYDPMPVMTFRPKWIWTKAIANASNGAVNFNVYKIESLSVVDIVGTLLHERSHKCGFNHIDSGWIGRRRANYKTENKCKYSVCYWLSENAKRFIKE